MTSQVLGCEGPSRPADLDDSSSGAFQRDDMERTIRSSGAIGSGGRLDLIANQLPCGKRRGWALARGVPELPSGSHGKMHGSTTASATNCRGTRVLFTRRRRKHPGRQPLGASLCLLKNVDGELGCRIEYCKDVIGDARPALKHGVQTRPREVLRVSRHPPGAPV